MTDQSHQPEAPKTRRIYKQRDLARPLDTLTVSQQKALCALARYRYMTVRQLVACGVASRPTTVRQEVMARLCRLSGNNLVQVDKYLPFGVTRGRFSHIYALTEHGAQVVADMLHRDAASVRYPVGGIQYANDFEHRQAYVDLCIAFDEWIARGEQRHCRVLTHYFDKTGANRKGTPCHSVNRIELPDGRHPVVPDGLALIDTETKRRALVVELHHKTDTKGIVEKLIELMGALSTGAIEAHLGHDKTAFVLSVATFPETKALVCRRMATVFNMANFAPVFLFNDLPTIMAKGFEVGWTHYDGTGARIFG